MNNIRDRITKAAQQTTIEGLLDILPSYWGGVRARILESGAVFFLYESHLSSLIKALTAIRKERAPIVRAEAAEEKANGQRWKKLFKKTGIFLLN